MKMSIELYFFDDNQFLHDLAEFLGARNYSVYDLNYDNFFSALDFCLINIQSADLVAVSIDTNKLNEQGKLDCVEYLQRSADNLISKLEQASLTNRTIGIKEYNVPIKLDPLTEKILKGYDRQIRFLLSNSLDSFGKFWIVGTIQEGQNENVRRYS